MISYYLVDFVLMVNFLLNYDKNAYGMSWLFQKPILFFWTSRDIKETKSWRQVDSKISSCMLIPKLVNGI